MLTPISSGPFSIIIEDQTCQALCSSLPPGPRMKESHIGTWTITTATALVLLIFFAKKLLLIDKNQNGKRGCRVPPGPRGWPLVGDGISWLEAVASSHPSRFVEEQVQRFGKIFSCGLFGRRAVVSADPAFNRFVILNEGKLFQSSYPKSFRDLVGKNGIITVHGEKQRRLHSIAFNMMRLDRLKSHFVNDIQTVMMQTLSFQDNQTIFLQDVCRKVAINLMVSQLLGISSEGEVDEMAQLFSDFVDGCLSPPINLPGFAYHTAMKARERIIKKINLTIEKRPEDAVAQEAGKGVLGRLLDEESLPKEAIADFIINLLFAGNETTAKTMLFAVYFLTNSPSAMKQVLEEQESFRRHCNGDRQTHITWEDYKSMKFTQCVIHETLRLGGIAIWLMREATEDVVYENYLIPRGCLVVPFLSAVHLDEGIYSEPLSFHPWRWLQPENQEKRNWRTSPVYTPFGGGARFCPGAELAQLQIALFLHYFVTTYRWTQLKEDRISFFPSARLVNGFKIQLNRRQEQ